MRKPALTLIEVIIYLALFAIIFSSIIQIVLSVSEANKNATQRIEVQRNSISFFNHIEKTFSKSNLIDRGASIFNQDQGRIRLTNQPNIYEYYLINGRIYYYENGAPYEMTNGQVYIEKFHLQEVVNNSNQITGVKIYLEIRSVQKEFIKFEYNTYLNIY
jgi:type II secretory pathway pseudopilin PulG